MVSASVGAYTTSNVTFTLTITNNCLTTTITPSTISSKSYVLAATTLTISFTAWTTPYTYCTSFTYSGSLTSPTVGSLPSFIAFSSASKTLTVYTTTHSDAGTY